MLEACRNVACVGGRPAAITDCLNFGSPDDPAVYYQLTEVIEGMAETCRAFETPVVSGNVSLYNESDGVAIWPTPVVGMLGLLEDLSARCDIGFRTAGDIIFGLGVAEPGLAGSEYLSHVHGQVAGRPGRHSEDRKAGILIQQAKQADGSVFEAQALRCCRAGRDWWHVPY